ncbi:MAG: ferritin family protein [candidate division WOR-3 bacterium]|nr:MAG: ferritin family protein [candidate division WOR-3 bacterium]
MSVFEPSEVFQFAIRIEEGGEKFYREMANKIENAEVKSLFSALADDEVKHKKTYQGMLSKIEEYEPFESYPGEYFSYLRAYADNIIFTPQRMEEEMKKITDAASALKFAIDRELDSILYYQEVKNLVPKNQRDIIDKIIEEERKHFMKLTKCSGDVAAACVRKD